VARRWRAIARAMRDPVAAQMILLGMDVDTAIAKVKAMRALATSIGSITVRVGADTSGYESGGNRHGSGGAEGRASGGSVRAGRTYDVGERGRERLTMFPGGGGFVTPAGGGRGGGGQGRGGDIHVHFHGVVNTASPIEMQRAADILGPALDRRNAALGRAG
jgi:SLT domain-containing protein